MVSQSSLEITCAICNRPISLDARFSSVDENGKAVHTECYVGQIMRTAKSSGNIPPQAKA
jgi:hypothetical protein